jgi:hypothetical protein
MEVEEKVENKTLSSDCANTTTTEKLVITAGGILDDSQLLDALSIVSSCMYSILCNFFSNP